MPRRTVLLPPRRDAAEYTEKQFLEQVIDAARTLGWEPYHPWLSIHSQSGWPDLALVRPPRLILAELKSQKGKLRESQIHWLDLLGRCEGFEVYLWRPADMAAEILQVLR